MKKEVFLSRSPEETESIGARLASTLASGVCVGLAGELGSGKTCFVRGMSIGLGEKWSIKSPSFTIMNIYSGGRLKLHHMDLYRLKSEEEFYGAGLDEYICGPGISVIEWADRFAGIMDKCDIVVRFSVISETERELIVEKRMNPAAKDRDEGI